LPHQCLNCGHIIPRGSDEILKGCSACGGKKFMFVDGPLPEKKRREIKRKADRVRDEILNRADDEIIEMLRERGIANISELSEQIGPEPDEGWIRLEPEPSKDKVTVEDREYEVVPGKRRSARDLISEFDRDIEEKGTFRTAVEEAEKAKRAYSSEEKEPTGKVKKGRKGVVKRKRGKAREVKVEHDVDVINIVETGVYEIDLDRLLEDNPIIVQKDGSYLIHLPSLFEKKKVRPR